MEAKESNAASTQGLTLEIRVKGERVLNGEEVESMTNSKGGSIDMDLVRIRLPESEKEASFSGISGDIGSQSAAGRGEDSSDENADTNRDSSSIQQNFVNKLHQMGAAQNNAIVLCSGTNTGLNFINIRGNMRETHAHSGMDLNVSSGHAIRTEEEYERGRREKRKQSNRESAKRSRFRRQQECEKLREFAEMLTNEISELPNELRRLSEECGKLDEENNSLIDEMEELYGPDAVSDLRAVNINSSDGGSNSMESKTPSRDKSPSPPPPPPAEPRLFGVTLRLS